MDDPGSGVALRRRGLLLVASASVVWSTGGLIVRLLDTDSWTTIFWRSLTAAVFLLALLLWRDGWRGLDGFRRMGWPGLVVGACFATASIALVVALSLTTVAKTLVILSASPLIAALLGRVMLGERIRPGTWATIAAVIVGISLMVSDSLASGSLAGDLVALLIAVSYALAIVVTRRYHGVGMTPAACTGAILATLVALPLASPWSVSAGDFALLCLFGAGQLGLGMQLFVAGARLVPAAHSALIGTLEPILGPLWVWMFLGEQPTVRALIGGAIVLGSVVGNTLWGLRRR